MTVGYTVKKTQQNGHGLTWVIINLTSIIIGIRNVKKKLMFKKKDDADNFSRYLNLLSFNLIKCTRNILAAHIIGIRITIG